MKYKLREYCMNPSEISDIQCCLIFEALRWRITKIESVPQRKNNLEKYISVDICENNTNLLELLINNSSGIYIIIIITYYRFNQLCYFKIFKYHFILFNNKKVFIK